MKHDLDQTLALLAATPAALNALLRELPEVWTHRNEGGDSWTATEVIGHLVHCERVDWMARAKRILEFGAHRAFDPFDRSAHLSESRERPLTELLDEFTRLRAQNLEELRAMRIGPEELAFKGLHPALGVLTLSDLLAAWAVHDMTHLHQISRILAVQYREATGPFAAYLGVLKCAGHGA
ncbi:MAG TPA: DinB family protein [Terracidiphilus sp.]|jgi:DinB superfamily